MGSASVLPPDGLPPRPDDTPTVIDLPAGDVLALPATPTSPIALAVPRPDVLVVAGLPGAGKSTLLRSAADGRDVVLDPERLAAPLRAALPWIPYGVLRPLVHVAHRVRVVYELTRGTGSLVVHEPGARPRWRQELVRLARHRGRHVHLLVVLADPEVAEAGRVRRARTLPARLAARHERVWAGLADELAHGWAGSRLAGEGFTGCTLLPRSAVPYVTSLRGRETP